MKFIQITPTYNEAQNLPLLVSVLFSLDIPGLQLLVVDDNSPDGTGQIAEELKKTFPSWAKPGYARYSLNAKAGPGVGQPCLL